jgi:hypothetical protein
MGTERDMEVKRERRKEHQENNKRKIRFIGNWLFGETGL